MFSQMYARDTDATDTHLNLMMPLDGSEYKTKMIYKWRS